MFNKSAEKNIINGTEKILIKLIIAVRDIDKATSPLANFVRILDVTPPGAAAIIITPKAISVGILIILINKKAIIGKIIIWQNKPTKKSFGYLNTLKKSPIFKDVPKPNIINAKAIGDINFAVSIKKLFNCNILAN